MKKLIFSTPLILAAAFGLAACMDTDAQYNIPQVDAPALVSTYPASGETVSASDKGELTLTVKYNKRVFFASSTYNKIQFSGGTISKAIVYGTDSVLTINVKDLKPGAQCSVTIPQGLVTGPNKMEAGAVTYSFNIKAPAPLDKNPASATSDEAKKLYAFLSDNFESKTISGMMADVSWNNKEAEKVNGYIGKYPAINGYDYIHIPASVAGANWINYNDITPLKEWSDNGGIVTIGWHWCVPSVEVTTEKPSAEQPTTTETTVWEGSENIGNDWAKNVTIANDKFAGITAGTIIKIYADHNSDATYWQIKPVDGSWSEITSHKDLANEWGTIDLGSATETQFALNEADAKSISETGLIIMGYGITVKKVSIIQTAANAKKRTRAAVSIASLDPGKDFSYNTKDFSIHNAVTEGTWENAFVKYDLANAAGYLKKVQEAGIPVLWRPLHEASGKWFWWGMGTPEDYKKLWIMMFEYFKTEGINNLIWVWTSQVDDDDWYPGDKYVDVIGVDIYGGTTANAVEKYQKVRTAHSNKIVTLSECGYSEYEPAGIIPTINQQIGAGAKWAWFMPWYSTDVHAPQSWWEAIKDDANILWRGDINLK